MRRTGVAILKQTAYYKLQKLYAAVCVLSLALCIGTLLYTACFSFCAYTNKKEDFPTRERNMFMCEFVIFPNLVYTLESIVPVFINGYGKYAQLLKIGVKLPNRFEPEWRTMDYI